MTRGGIGPQTMSGNNFGGVGAGITNSFNSWIGSDDSSFFNGVSNAFSLIGNTAVIVGGAVIEYCIGIFTGLTFGPTITSPGAPGDYESITVPPLQAQL